jgi:S1-C subfamily serine protease
VINIGNPGAVDWTFSTTQGSVRGIGVADWVVGGHGEVLRIKARMVTITNPINPGDSGGPLIDRRGYQVGVCESGKSGVQNVNNCVDITEVWDFLNEKKITIKILSEEKGDVLNHKDPVSRKTPGKSALDKDPQPGNGGTTPPPEKGTTPPEKKETGPVDPAANAPSAADEKAADMLLQQAKVFAKEDDKDYYATKLKNVIAKYPATKAAKEAKTLLAGLK